MRRSPRRFASFAAAGLLAAAVAFAGHATGALDRLEGDTVDLRFQLRGERAAESVAVVAIDDRTFNELGEQWPFPRSLHGRVIDRLSEAGARQIAYDVQFTERTKPRQDMALFDAVRRAGHVVLSTTEVNPRGDTNVLGGDANLREVGARAGNTSVPIDAGGMVRRVPYSVDGLETFAVAAAEAATGRQIDASEFPDGGATIDYHGRPGTVPTLSFSDVMLGRFDPAAVRGKVVVVGASAPSLQDVHPTPTAGGQLMAGPELQANAISTVIRGLPLRETPWPAGLAAILALGLICPLAATRFSFRLIGAIAFVLLVALAASAVLLFNAGEVLPFVAPAFALVLGLVVALALKFALEARERRRTRELFERFVPRAVVGELLGKAGADRRLAGVRRESTVLFVDLRGFTPFAEALQAESVLELLNRHLTEMSEAVLDHGGTVVSYMGDGLMAVFGSPVDCPDHASRGLAAGREMLEVRLPRLNAWLGEQGLPGFELGVGLNSGPVMSGTVGSDRRLEYAAVGDTTNVAARLESMTKETDGGLMLSGATYELLRPVEREALQSCGERTLKGRAEPITVWSLTRGGAQASEYSPNSSRMTPQASPSDARSFSAARSG